MGQRRAGWVRVGFRRAGASSTSSGGVTSIIAGTNVTISSTGAGGTGDVTVNSAGGGPTPGGAPPAIASVSSAGAAATYSRSDHTHALDLVAYNPSVAGMQASGVVQQTYGAPTATPTVLTMVARQIPFGGAGGTLTQSAKLVWTDAAASEALDVTGAGTAGNVLALNLRNSTVVGTSQFISLRAFIGTSTQVGQALFTHVGGATNSITLSITQSAANADDQLTVSGTASGGQGALIAYTQNKDVLIGSSAALAAAATRGFVYLPVTTTPPTGVPTLVGGVPAGSRLPTTIGTGLRWYMYDNVTAAWHFSTFNDYDPTATRIPFGGATAHTLTDTAAMTYTTSSQTLTLTGTGGLTEAPLVISVGDVSGRAIHFTAGAVTITSDTDVNCLPGGLFSAGGAGATDFQINTTHNLALGSQSQLATNATNGFPFMRTTNGTPTGVPAASYGGVGPKMAAFLADDSANKLWIYFPTAAAWKSVLLI
jgi:hypothetical protein